MSSAPSVPQAPRRPTSLEELNPGRVAQVDRSLVPAVPLLAVSAALWLVLGTLLATVGSLQLHLPEFLAGCEWLTYGRVRDLESVALVYGWGINAALAVALGIAHRLGKVESRHAWVATVGAVGWNLALGLGALALLRGRTTGVAGLELPRETGLFLVACFLAVGLWVAVAFVRRQTAHVFAAQWYLVAAVLAFPVLHLLAQLAVLWTPARGVVQAVVAAWHAHGLVALVLTPVAIASLYYVIPKELGRPIRAYYLASVAFWLLVVLGGWTGMAGLIGSPIPVWLQSSGVVAAGLLAVPAIILAIHFHGTFAAAGLSSVGRTPALRLAALSATVLLVWMLAGVALSFRGASAAFRFTDVAEAHALLGLHGFVGPAFLAALTFLLPRVLRREWPSRALASAHFWATLLGLLGAVSSLGFLGWAQATGAANLGELARNLNAAASLSLGLLLVGNLAFLAHVAALFLSRGERRAEAYPQAR